ncbi:MAG: hypothetical protein U1E65_31455 [Myxococcota bacterium]
MGRRGRAIARGAVLAVLFASCGGGCALAELLDFEGRAERDLAKAPEQWQPAQRGASFRMGDAVRTREASKAELKLSGGGVLKLGASTAVRFLSEAPGAADVRVESGDAEIEAGDGVVNVFTANGRARVLERGKLVVHRDGNGQTRFSVVVGNAVIEDDEGAAPIAAGASLTLPRQPPPRVAPAATSTLAVRTATRAPVAASEPAPEGALELSPGMIVHGPIPLSLAVPDSCGGPGSLILKGASDAELLRVNGGRRFSFVPPLGAQRYEIRCADGRLLPGGALLRSADEGKKARSGPATIILDGQPKVVLRDPVEPAVRLRWPSAPNADAYSLVLERMGPGKKEPERVAIERPEHSPTLAEGKYRVWFEVAESDQRSPATEIEVKGSAGIEIGELSARAGKLNLLGRVPPGATVTVDGAEVRLAPDGRFHAILEVQGPPTVLVRVDDPKLGLNIYARRRPGPDARSKP